MNISPGQVWITRNQRRARIYAIDGFGRHAVHGAVLEQEDENHHGGWVLECWGADGVYGYTQEPNPYDLISQEIKP